MTQARPRHGCQTIYLLAARDVGLWRRVIFLKTSPHYITLLQLTGRPVVLPGGFPPQRVCLHFHFSACVCSSICNEQCYVDTQPVGLFVGSVGLVRCGTVACWRLCFRLVPTRWRCAVVFPARLMWGVQVEQGWASSEGVLGSLHLAARRRDGDGCVQRRFPRQSITRTLKGLLVVDCGWSSDED